ncbi:MAG TPA: hypothetical protein VNO19_10575 [Gemmatimonadales bacterium]|nr:hypothetical protein [Gemmatimonadales bacterium]
MRPVQLFALAFILSACGRETPETGARGTASASPYTADSKDRAREDGLEGTNSGSELEAPRLIPAVRNQLDLMSSGSPTSTENVTAYKNLVSDLVTSMQADLYRVGFADSGQFRALTDSVLDDLGGGSGTSATGPAPSQMKQHVARVRRLLDSYQQTMKGAANKL